VESTHGHFIRDLGRNFVGASHGCVDVPGVYAQAFVVVAFRVPLLRAEPTLRALA
jgi:hypothetical protein